MFIQNRIRNVSKLEMRPGCRLFVILTACALFSACNEEDVIPALPDEANDRVSITNNLATLNTRVTYDEQTVAIDNSLSLPSNLRLPAAAKKPKNAFSLTLVAQILPPTVAGEVVQATSVSLNRSHRGLVSYNMRGAPRLGAVDFITKFRWSSPRLTSGLTFDDSDINAVTADGKYIYTAVATDAVDFPYPAVMERVRIKGNSLTLEDNVRVPLTSYAGTSVMPGDEIVFATSGNTGGVFAFEKESLNQLGEFPLHDARWVEWDEDSGRIVVAQGTPGMLSIFEDDAFPDGSMSLINSFPFPGADVAESKSTVEVAGGKAFIAAGPDGVQIMCLDSGLIIGSVPIPDPAFLGLDPAVVVSNAVSVDQELMFISNGEAGVYVAQGSESFNDNNCNTQNITVLGKLRFDDLQSANHVAYKSGYLYVAAGLGGVKIIRVDID